MRTFEVTVEGYILEPQHQKETYIIEANDLTDAKDIAEEKFIDSFDEEVEVDDVEAKEIAPPIIEEPVVDGQVSLFEEGE